MNTLMVWDHREKKDESHHSNQEDLYLTIGPINQIIQL